MHIAYNGWFWDQPQVGSGQYIRRLLPQLRRLNPDLAITLILPPHISDPDEVPDGVTVIQTKGPGGRFGKIWFEQRTYPQAVARSGADIAHVPYWGPPLRSPARLVASILDVVPLVIPAYADGFGNRLYVSLVRAASANMAHTITISDAAKQDIVNYLDIPADEITTTYLGVDPAYHPRMGAERDEQIREKYDLPEHFVLYMGSYDLRKQVNELMLAYTYVGQAEGDNYPLVLAGKEPDWSKDLYPDLRRYAERLAITEYVRWIGYVDEADKPALYRLADVFAYPSMYEGFGLQLVEAMASGTPIVANNIPVFAEIVGEGAYLTDNAREMGGAIIALLLQEPLRDTMVNQGLAQATRYNWRKTAQQTLEIYEKVMTS